MSEVNQQAAQQQAAQPQGRHSTRSAADAQAADRAAREAAPAAGQSRDVFYETREESSVLFDILVRGEHIRGYWSPGKRRVRFRVPESLASAFEQQYHFRVGNVIRSASDDELAKGQQMQPA